MGHNKIKSLVAAATLATTLPVAAHQSSINSNNTVLTTRHNSQNINSNIGGTPTTLDEINSSNNSQNIDYSKDLQIDISNIVMQKTSSGNANPDTQYQPETTVPTTGNIATTGTEVNYQISVSLRSKTGKLYPVDSAYLTADPMVKYINQAGDSPQEQKAEQELLQSIDTQLGKLKKLNSTSTFTITASFNLGASDWNAEMIPNLKLNLKTPNGKVITIPLNVDNIKETNKYINSISANPSLTPVKGKEHEHEMTINFEHYSNSYSPGVYNPNNQKLKSITFKVNNPDPSQMTITPENVPGLVKNSDGTYTATGEALVAGKNLFKVTTTTDKQLRQTITVTPINAEMESGAKINASEATVNKYNPGGVVLTQRDFGAHFTMKQTSQTTNTVQDGSWTNCNNVTFGSSMSSGVPGKYEVYVGSLVTNGQIVLSNKLVGGNVFNKHDAYCHLNDNAVNILKSGTAEQKAQIMNDIVTGNMDGIGVRYMGSEIDKILSSGKELPTINFVYNKVYYGGKNISYSDSYTTAPLQGNKVPVISRTITYGKLFGDYTDEQQKQMAEELKGGQLPSDGVIDDNGKLQGFILTPPNSYTDEKVQKDVIYQITDERYGDYSHGLSSGYNQATEQTDVSAGNAGQTGSNTVSTVKYSWFTQPQQINVTIQGYGDGTPLEFDNSTITVNMGHTFEVQGPIQINGWNVPKSDYKIDGDKLIIQVPKNSGVTLSSAPSVQYTAKYTNPQSIDGPVVLSASVSGPDGHQGLNYHYNNQVIPADKGGMPNVTNYQTKIVISKTISNDCLHYETTGANNTVTLGNVITNNNKITKTYYIAGEIPTTGDNNLPGNDGEPSTGDLGTELQSLNTDGAPTWVLPKSAMNSENEEILTSPSGLNLKGKLSYVENPANGWVKYTPGMDLSNMVGYFVAPTVGSRGSYTMTYNVKLTNVGKGPEGIPQIVNSAFKYYDATDNIGSTSNIVNIAAPGTNLQNSWISTVKGIGCTITADDLNKTVDVNGKKVSLKDLLGNGPDIDENYDNTPTKLMNEVTLSQDAETLKKLGYKLVNITVNGKVRDLNWFENQGIVDNTGLTEVTFNLKPLVPEKPVVTDSTTTVKEVYSNGKPVVDAKTTTNKIGSTVDTKIPTIPDGYQITKVTVNGQQVDINKVPTTQSKDNQTIIYTIGKIPTHTDTVKVVDSDGKQIGSAETSTGIAGKETELKTPKIPDGYHIVSITNDKGEKVTGVPSTFGDSDNTTIYHIAKDITDKVYVDVKTESGTILTPSHEVASGTPGSKIDVEMPEVPEGYHIVKVTVDNKVITPNAEGKYELPKTLSDNQNQEVDNHIEVIVAKNPTTTVEEKYQDGTNVVPDKTTTNLQGAKVETGLPKLPEGYKVIKITVNGKGVQQNEVPTVQSKDNQTIIYTIGKVSTDTVKVVDENSKPVVPEVSVTGVSGTETGLKTPEIPNGYHIVSVTNNGKTVEPGVPSKFTNDDQNIVYHIAKNPNTTVSEVYPDGKPVVASKTTVNLAGAKVDTAIPELPNGYQITKITVNGKVVSQNEVPTVQSKDNQTIVYTIGKMPTDTVKVVDNNGNELVPVVSKTGKTGTETGLKVPTIPNGYHVVNITDSNGKVVSGVPSTFGNSDNTVIYHVAKNVTDHTYATIKTTNGDILVPTKEVASGMPGEKEDVVTPKVPQGYEVVKVTVNGTDVTPNKDGKYEITNNSDMNKEIDNNIVITVKHVPVQDTVKVKLPNGTEISSSLTIPGMPGDNTGINTPAIPAGYHIGKITVDGKDATEAPKVYGDKDSIIVYHLVQNAKNDIVSQVVTQGGTVLTNNTVVAEGPEGTTVNTKETPIPNNYHLVKVVYNGKQISTTSNGKIIYTLPNKIENTEGKLVYVVAPNTSSANVQVTDGEKTFYNHTTEGNVGSDITGNTPVIPKGYKIVNITVGGHTVSDKDLPKVYGNKDVNIVYHVVKIPTGVIEQEVKTTDGTIIVEDHTVANGEIGQSVDIKPYTAPKGYHIIKVLVDGKEIDTKDENEMIHNLPNTINRPQTQITYVIQKDAVQTGKITVYVQDQSGELVGTPKSYTGAVGSNTPNMVPTIPEGDTVTSITENNNIITSLPKTFADGDQVIVYHVNASNGKLTYVININGHEVKVGSLTGKTGDTANYDLPKNSHLKLESITVNGNEVPTNPEFHGKFSHNGTVVVYNYITVVPSEDKPVQPVKPEQPTKPVDKPSDKPEQPVKPADKPSTGNEGHKDNNKPSIPETGDQGHKEDKPADKPVQPVKPEQPTKPADKPSTGDQGHKEEKPSTPTTGDQGHKENKPSDIKPVKPEQPTKPSDTGHKEDVKPTKPSDKPSDIKPVKPETPNKENPSTPATGDKGHEIKPTDKPSTPDAGHKEDVKPVKPADKPSTGDKDQGHKEDVKPSTPSDVKPVKPTDKPSESGDKTPSKPSDKPSTGDQGHKEEKPSTPSDKPATPSQGDKGQETKPVKPADKPSTPSESGNQGHKEDKPSKPSDIKPTTPTQGHEDNKPSTPTSDKGQGHEENIKPVKPSTPDAGKGQDHKEVKPSTPSDVKPVKPSEKPSTPSSNKGQDHKEVKPSTPDDSKVHEVKPSTPSTSTGNTETKGNTTSNNGNTIVDNNTTSNNGNTVVNNNNSTDSTSTVNTLPHTGLSGNGTDNAAKEAGALAGILGILGGIFAFRRKK